MNKFSFELPKPSAQELQLIANHPLLFPTGKAPNCWAYSIPVGWAALIDQLCTEIETAFEPDVLACMTVHQIKEKFGVLRFTVGFSSSSDEDDDDEGYDDEGRVKVFKDWSASRDKLEAIIAKASDASAHTCLYCASKAEVENHGGYMTPICPSCRDKRANQASLTR